MVKLESNIVDWMRKLSGLLVLLPNFNSLVALSRDQSDSRMIESGGEYSPFSRYGTRLHFTLNLLEIIS